MDESINLYDYVLPVDSIAQSPAVPRQSARLMMLNRNNQSISHAHVADLPSYFRKGDVLVVNNTKVFHARLNGMTNGKRVELFLIRPLPGGDWLTLGKPGKKFSEKVPVIMATDFTATITEKHPDGTMVASFNLPPDAVIEKANIYGEIPVPPYIKTIPVESDYQTVYAKYVGSVAAPTAGFHLTKNILDRLTQKGVTILEITLHVGLGTFLPIKTDSLDTHTMHSEWVNISEQVAEAINRAIQDKRRIIAVGTTTVRTLEGVAALHNGNIKAYQGDINLFIKPGFRFTVINAMLTNFHLPKSTLIVLVSSFAGREFILQAYKTAVENNYRFYSFGDAMLIE